MFVGVFCAVILFPFILGLFVSPQSPIDRWRKILGDPEYTKVDLRKPLRSQTRTIILGDRTFEIPLMYINGSLPKGEKQVGVNLVYVLPDFRSKLEFRTRQEYEEVLKSGEITLLLVQVAEKHPPIPRMIKNRMEFGRLKQRSGKEYGLEKYTDQPLSNGHQPDDVYLEIRDEKIISFIDCSVDSSVPFPGCSHYFEDKGILYKLHYNKKKHFSKWQEQRLGAVKFFNSFEITNKKGK